MRIAHLSDLHLTRGPLAAQPAAALADALARLLALEPRPDCVIITGDLADTGHPDSAGFLLHLLDGTRCVTHSVAVSHAAVRAF
jgi:3',5'-cyclic AMP phosphodiesterase CpdA